MRPLPLIFAAFSEGLRKNSSFSVGERKNPLISEGGVVLAL